MTMGEIKLHLLGENPLAYTPFVPAGRYGVGLQYLGSERYHAVLTCNLFPCRAPWKQCG